MALLAVLHRMLPEWWNQHELGERVPWFRRLATPDTYRGYLVKIPVQVTCDFWWPKWHWDRLFSGDFFSSPVSTIPSTRHIYAFVYH